MIQENNNQIWITIYKVKERFDTRSVNKAKEILSQVNVSLMCSRLDISRATIRRVLDGTSKDIGTLTSVTYKANKEIYQNSEILRIVLEGAH